jgi:hypothetical protein
MNNKNKDRDIYLFKMLFDVKFKIFQVIAIIATVIIAYFQIFVYQLQYETLFSMSFYVKR